MQQDFKNASFEYRTDFFLHEYTKNDYLQLLQSVKTYTLVGEANYKVKEHRKS